MSGHGRHRGIPRRQHYSDLPQDEQELNPIERRSRSGGRKPPDEKTGESRGRAEPTSSGTPDAAAGLLHHHQRHPLRGGVRSDSDDPSSPGDFGYGAARRDFRRHYKGSSPPTWNRTATFRPDGTGELQTYYQALGDNAQSQLARKYDHRKQFFHLLGKILLRWFASFVLSVAMVVAFYQYEKVKILDTKAKRWFNAVSTGLYLTLGLNLAASLKGMSIIVRWKLLARKKHQLEEVDFLLGLSSLIKVFRYGIHIAGKRPFTSLACFSWILFNAVGRLSVALTGLTYSYDSFGAVSAQDGLANVTDWTTFSEHDEFSRDLDSTPDAERYSAHSFGLFSVILKNQPLTQPGEGDPNEPLDRPIEVRSDGSWSYYFREFNPNPKNPHNNLAHKSKRFVTVSATCEYYALVEGQYGNVSTVAYLNGTQQTTLSGISDYGPAATTWINPRSDLPRNQGWNCGSRCAAVAALQFLDSNGTGNGGFYNCQVHVSKVQGGTAPEHEIPDDIATIAAGSIGLEGYTVGPNSWEYVRYTPDSPWSNYGVSMDDATYMARIASRFAIGAIAMKDIYGLATAQAQGQIAWVGVLLKVKWPALLLILGSILICQLLMGCAVVAYSNTVFCKDDSYLSTARLLRPVVERLGPSGCAMTGKDIAHTLREYMVYGTRTVGDRHHLDLGEDIPVVLHFPQGWYDGYEEWVDDHEEIPVVAAAQKSSGRSRRKFITNVRKRRAFGRV